MVKVEVTETFNFKDYAKVETIQKKNNRPENFEKGDIFVCDDDIARYLSGENALKKKVINVLEVIPSKEEAPADKPAETPKKKKKKQQNVTKE